MGGIYRPRLAKHLNKLKSLAFLASSVALPPSAGKVLPVAARRRRASRGGGDGGSGGSRGGMAVSGARAAGEAYKAAR